MTFKLNHANLIVDDVQATEAFFARHFGFTTTMRHSGGFVIMSDGDGFTFNLLRSGKDELVTYPKNFHLGFFVDSDEIVYAKQAELAGAGFAPSPVQSFNRAGAVTCTFYCQCPGGFLIEVAHSDPI